MQFQIFYNSIKTLEVINVDAIIAAVALLKPLPDSIKVSSLQRSTKRNVYPIIMVNTIRLLCGTFQWKLSQQPTSIDKVFNTPMVQQTASGSHRGCNCPGTLIHFTLDDSILCPHCNNASSFLSTAARLSLITASNKSSETPAIKTPLDNLNNNESAKNTKKNYTKGKSQFTNESSTIMRDITNLPPMPPPLCLAARPNDAELNIITRVNNMLSNYVVSYFFKILENTFSKILYQEFLFDFVKREGGWKQFVQYSRRERHSINFLEKLKDRHSTCIVPICCDLHWTVLIRTSVGNAWIIYFVDTISQGSDSRMNKWRDMFQDDDLFSGKWIKLKIIPQSELECGARVCLHWLCIALSLLSASETIRRLERIKDLAVRSRLLVSCICKQGNWSPQGWLKSIIGTPVPVITDL